LLSKRFLQISKHNLTSKHEASAKRRKSRLLWYLLPIFLQIVGGLIVYFSLRNSNPTTAKNALWVGIILSTVTAVIVMYLYQGYQADMAAALDRIATGGGQVISTAYGHLEYADVGSGYPILAIHGAGGGYDQGVIISEMLLGDNDFRVIAPSRFGFLNTPLPDREGNRPSSFAAQADAYADLLDKLNIKKVAVFGFSAGGPSSIEFALRHPDKTSALVLVSAVVHKEPPMSSMDDIIHNGLFKSDFAFWLLGKYFQPQLISFLGMTPEVQAKLTSDERSWLSDTLIPSMFPISQRQPGMVNDRINFASINYPLEQINVPTLVVNAKDDTLVNASHSLDAVQKIPNAKHIEYDSGGHVLMTHHQDTKSAIIDLVMRHGEVTEESVTVR
jgi:2-hydroxy-6-oxonona-2,4-dienedioate hydrolase